MDSEEIQYINIGVQRKRIIDVIKYSFEKLDIAYFLDDLVLENGKRIAPYLTTKELKLVLDTFIKFKKVVYPSKSHMALVCSNVKIRIKKPNSNELKLENQFSEVLTILHRKRDIRKIIQTIARNKTDESIDFLFRINELKKYIIEMINATAEHEEAHNKQVAQVFKNNVTLKTQIKEMENFIIKRKQHILEITQEKEQKIDFFRQQLVRTRNNCDDYLKLISINMETNMLKYQAINKETMNELKEKMKDIMEEYHKVQNTHLAHEKKLRNLRYKTETVYINLVAKYDQEMSELQERYDQLCAEFDKEQDKYNNLKKLFDEQEVVYNELMQEKQEEDERIFNKKRYEFIMNRAARVIQRWWRKILTVKKGKKKRRGTVKQSVSKKGKKQKR